MNKIYGLLFLTLSFTISCKQTVLPDTQSNLSEITFATDIGKSDKFYELLGGKSTNCPNYKGSGCDEASAFLTYYEAKFTSQKCDDKTASGKDSQTAKSVSLKQECTYNLKLSYKESAKSESCFEGSVDFSIKKGQTQVDANPIIQATAYCIAKGFPDIQVSQTNNSNNANVNVDPTFGSNNNNATKAGSISMDSILNRIKESIELLNLNKDREAQEVLSAQKGKQFRTTLKLESIDARSSAYSRFYIFSLNEAKHTRFLNANNLAFYLYASQDVDDDSFKSMNTGEVFEVDTMVNYISKKSDVSHLEYSISINSKLTTFTKK